MKAPKDKRTKAYKEWKKKFEQKNENKSEGFGDTIEKFTVITGIKKVVEFIAGEDCGCDERKEKLNKVLPYHKPLCLNEKEYNFLSFWFGDRRLTINPQQQQQLLDIYNRVFQTKRKLTTCNSCVKEVVNDLEKLFKTYL
jgi:hypothetical protein